MQRAIQFCFYFKIYLPSQQWTRLFLSYVFMYDCTLKRLQLCSNNIQLTISSVPSTFVMELLALRDKSVDMRLRGLEMATNAALIDR